MRGFNLSRSSRVRRVRRVRLGRGVAAVAGGCDSLLCSSRVAPRRTSHRRRPRRRVVSRTSGKRRPPRPGWPPECFTLPGSVEEIERGVTDEQHAAHDAYTLAPLGGRLVPVPTRATMPEEF